MISASGSFGFTHSLFDPFFGRFLSNFAMLLFFTLNREDFSFVIHLDRQPRTSRRREAQTGSRARSGSRSERTLDAVEHSRTLMEWWPFLIFHRGGLRIKVINNKCPLGSALRYHSCAQAPSNTIRSFPPCLDERLTEAPHSLPASSRPHPVSCHLSSLSTLELLAPIQIQIRELPAEVDSVSETATNGPAFALPFQGQETGAKTVSPNTASRSRALNRCAQSSRSTAFENTHPAVCSADLASSRNTASISTPQTSQTLPLEVPARVPHKKDDQDSTQPHRVESIKSLGDFSFSSSSTCDAILHRHRMSLQRNIATGYDFFNGLLATR